MTSRKIRTSRAVFLSALSLILSTIASSLFAEIYFGTPDINSDSKIVFPVTHEIIGEQSFTTAIYADAATSSDVKIITCFPEKMELLSEGAVLQIRNRYGNARYSVADSTLTWISKADTIPAQIDKRTPQTVSPDGKWICYVKKTSAAFGTLILKNASTFQETVLDANADFSYESVPVLWSPDSAILLYEKSGAIYFCEPKNAFQKIRLAESVRKIGNGKISSVCWANDRTLFYIDRDIVYKISANELYTRGLYSSVVGSGIAAGRLPVAFDKFRDKFYVNKRSDSLALIQQNSFAMFFKIPENGFTLLDPVFTKYFSDNNASVTSSQVVWADDGTCLLWLDMLGMTDGKRKTRVYKGFSDFKLVSAIEESGRPAVSPDGKSLAFSSGEELFVYDIAQWKPLGKLHGEKLVSYVWSGNDIIYAGGVATVREWKLKSPGTEAGVSRTLFLSSVKDVFWRTPSVICASSSVRSDTFYDYYPAKNVWRKSSDADLRSAPRANVQNGKYRVFAGTTPNLKYANTLYIRTLSGKAVTKPLFPDTAEKCEGRQKIALIIDALDDVSGLTHILSVLKDYGIPATFFLNGEFIRRYPVETNQIAAGGFDCASMFFSAIDLTSKDFVVDEEYIRRGLARNEDEFFSATGKELSLIWHAPFYKSTAEIKHSGEQAGYKYAEAGRFSLDTTTLEQAARGNPWYLSASQIIAFYEENTTALSIIPVSTGISVGKRTDYLYEKLELLLGNLLDKGFEFVPVSQILR